MTGYYTYILRCCDDSLYTGIAADIHRRMKEHFEQDEKCARYTRSRKAKKLEALWLSKNRSTASVLESRIKQLRRKQKLQLIDSNDLSVFGDAVTADNYRRVYDTDILERWDNS